MSKVEIVASGLDKKASALDPQELAREKRRLIDSLDGARENSSPGRRMAARAVSPEIFAVRHALQALAAAAAGNPRLESCIAPIRAEIERGFGLKDELRISQDTCKMLEESLLSLENKLLEVIAENGDLHHRLDTIEGELMNARINVARLSRQRDELRRKLDETAQAAADRRKALSAAERELQYLVAKAAIEKRGA